MEAQEKKKKSPVRFIIIGVLLLVAVYFGWQWYYNSKHFETTDNAQIETHFSPVLARVAGYVQTVTVSDYATVKAGDTIALIDDKEYQLAVQQAEADFAQAESELEQAKADLAAVQADLRAAKVGVDNANLNVKAVAANAEVIAVRRDKAFQDYQRDQKLFAEKAITQHQLEDSKARYEEQVKAYEASIDQKAFSSGGVNSGQAQVVKAQAQLQRIAAQQSRAEAAISVRKSQLDQAKLKLTYTRIVAPIDGKIGRKNIEPGQYVQPGQNLCTIVNDDQYWIVANFKETQIDRLKEGQNVEVHMDAYKSVKITGKVASLSEATGAKFSLLPADNASGNWVKTTQRVPVRINIDNPAELKGVLRAGLSVEVDVRVN
ncbi:MAG: HlyD family efflux transporter periplasmic adaptor subunit [Bacteroidetes bacterium]|nr:HlyD family efflux transporter periplasmic adaptor subunit [Bacteroidota bacterium]